MIQNGCSNAQPLNKPPAEQSGYTLLHAPIGSSSSCISHETMTDNSITSTTDTAEGISDCESLAVGLDSPTHNATLLESCSEKIPVVPWETVTHYGGAAIGENEIFASLPRKVSLPIISSSKIKDPQAKALYDRTVNDCEFSFKYSYSQYTEPSNKAKFHFEIFETSESPDPFMELKFELDGVLSVEDGVNGTLGIEVYITSLYRLFCESWNASVIEKLSLRVVHTIMRHYGGRFHHSQIVTCLGEYLRRGYKNKNKSNNEAHLDAAICVADILVSRQDVSRVETAAAFVKVGECLEALEEYSTAADVYERATDLSSGQPFEVTPWVSLGIAWERAGEYNKAEAAFYRALHTAVVLDGRKLLLDNETIKLIVYHTLYLYFYMRSMKRQEARPYNDQDKMGCALTSLFYAAGYDYDPAVNCAFRPWVEK